MLYDILSIADEREQTVYITNSSTFSENNILVLTNCFLNRQIYVFLIMIRDFSIELNNDIPSWLEHWGLKTSEIKQIKICILVSNA